MYDSFSTDYDRFVNWASRLDVELPFIEREINAAWARQAPIRVLDAACGTGMHAIALAKHGYRAAGADISARMIERARANADAAKVAVPFVAAGFGQLAQAYHSADAGLLPFDVLLCLGNSLPHLLNPADLAASIKDFAACLRPGGLLLVQNRNFDAVLRRRERWMEPQGYRENGSEGEREWLFLRFYDYQPDGLINFNIITLHRAGQGAWQQQERSTLLYPLRRAELVDALKAAGFQQITLYGSLAGAPFDEETSGNLVVEANTT